MSNLQYIGARYVPAFYENPDTGDMTWKSGVGYEPLTVVTYNSDTYTSKKPVPSSVGDPASNPTYWAKTADFNAALVSLQNQVNNIDNVELPAIDARIDNVISEKTIFISDSYGVTNGGFIDWLDDTGLIDEDDVIGLAQGGIGFHDGGYLTLLQNAVIADHSSIKRIVVVGGANDHQATYNDLETAIAAFSSYAKSNYPNAKLYLGHVGWSDNATLREKYATVTIPAYRTANLHGFEYLYGLEYFLHYYGYFDNDGIHPTTAGCKALASGIMQALISGSYHPLWSNPSSTTKFNMQGNDWIWYTNVVDDEVEIVTNDCNLTFSNQNIAKNTDHAIGTLSTTDFIHGYPNIIRNGFVENVCVNGTDWVPCFMGISQTGTNTASFTMRFYYDLTGVNSIKIPNLTEKMKLLFC